MPRLFAYGTLLSAARQKRLFGRLVAAEPAALEGWRRARCVGRYFGIVRTRGARTRGGVLRLTRAELACADRWEGVPDLYRRRRVRVACAGGGRDCWAYVPVRPAGAR